MRTTRTLPLYLTLLLTAAASAGDVYKWQDENGNWHFSDIPPEDGGTFETITMPTEPRQMVTMRKYGPERTPSHAFFNHYWGPAEIRINLSDAENVRPDPPLPARFVIPGQAEMDLVRFEPIDDRRGFRYRLAYAIVPGPPSTDLPADLDYFPPFPVGDSFPISQGIDDASTHTDSANRYAVDVVMPEGTPVLAAREGVVMDVEDDFHGGGRKDRRLLPRANQVRLLHDDGSMTVYAHLEPNSARVRPGMRVQAGHWIANSGNTGYSSGPHLHFAVQMNIGMALESLPFRFKLPAGGSMDPDHPQMLQGVLPVR